MSNYIDHHGSSRSEFLVDLTVFPTANVSLSNHLLLPSCCFQTPLKSQGYRYSSPQHISYTVRIGILETHLTDSQSIWSPGTCMLNGLKEVLCSGNQMPVGSS